MWAEPYWFCGIVVLILSTTSGATDIKSIVNIVEYDRTTSQSNDSMFAKRHLLHVRHLTTSSFANKADLFGSTTNHSWPPTRKDQNQSMSPSDIYLLPPSTSSASPFASLSAIADLSNSTLQPFLTPFDFDAASTNGLWGISGQKWAFTVPLLVVMLFTMVGNVLVVISVFTYNPLRNVQNMFLVSLAISDITVAVCVMPFSVAYYLIDRWVFGIGLCKFWLTCDVLCCTASILNLCAIAVDRYQAIHDPINYRAKRTLSRVLVTIVIVWLLSALTSVPPLLGWNDWPDVFDESVPCKLTEQPGYVLFSASVSFYIPLVIMTTVYVKIFVATKQRLRRRAQSSARISVHKVSRKALPVERFSALPTAPDTRSMATAGLPAALHSTSGASSTKKEVFTSSRDFMSNIPNAPLSASHEFQHISRFQFLSSSSSTRRRSRHLSISDHNTSSSAEEAVPLPETGSTAEPRSGVESLDLANPVWSDRFLMHQTQAKIDAESDQLDGNQIERDALVVNDNNNNISHEIVHEYEAASNTTDLETSESAVSRSIDLAGHFVTNHAIATELPLLNRPIDVSNQKTIGNIRTDLSHGHHSTMALCAAAISLSQPAASTGTSLLTTESGAGKSMTTVHSASMTNVSSGIPVSTTVTGTSSARFGSFNLLRKYRSRFHRANQQHGSCFSNWEPSNTVPSGSSVGPDASSCSKLGHVSPVIRSPVPWIRPSIGVVSATSTPTGSPDGSVSPAIDLKQVQAALRVGGRGALGGRSHSGSSSVKSTSVDVHPTRPLTSPSSIVSCDKQSEDNLLRQTNDDSGCDDSHQHAHQDHQDNDASIILSNDNKISDQRRQERQPARDDNIEMGDQSIETSHSNDTFGSNRINATRLNLCFDTETTPTAINAPATGSSSKSVRTSGKAMSSRKSSTLNRDKGRTTMSQETGSVGSSSHHSSQSNMITDCAHVCVSSPGCITHLEPPTVWRRNVMTSNSGGGSINSIVRTVVPGQSSSSGGVCVFSCNSSCTSTSAWTSSSQPPNGNSTANLQRLAAAAAAKAGLDHKSSTMTTTAAFGSQSNGGGIGQADTSAVTSAIGTTTSAMMGQAGASNSALGTGPTNTGAITVKQAWEQKQRISLSKERKAAQVLGIVMGAFIACWLPFFLMYVTLPFCGAHCDLKPNAELIIVWLGYVNSALNPIIYTIFNLDFRRAFKRIFARCCSCAKRTTTRVDKRRSNGAGKRIRTGKDANRVVGFKTNHHAHHHSHPHSHRPNRQHNSNGVSNRGITNDRPDL